MNDSAQRWTEEVLPRVAMRQWVVTVPWSRRWLLARRPALARGVLRIALSEIRQLMARRSQRPDWGHGQTGIITVIQRFGSALNLNLHFHILVLDGEYRRHPRTGHLCWMRTRAPTTEQIERLVERLVVRSESWLARRGFGANEPINEDPEDAQSQIQAASVMGRSAAGGRRARRVQMLGGKPHQLPPRCATCDGYTVHAGVVIGARNRKGLKRLCRYIARPPLAKDRLRIRSNGSVQLLLKRQWSDGTVAISLTPLELVERLAALIPPPRKNQVIYHGVLAARSRLRKQVVPGRRRPRVEERSRRLSDLLTRRPSEANPPRWTPWRELLKRSFGVDGFACPICGQRMMLRAVVMPPATFKVLSGLEAASRAPPRLASLKI